MTTTFTAPAACTAVVPLIAVGLALEIATGEPPNETVAPDTKFEPFTVTAVPPALDPLFGNTEVTVGAGAGAA